MNAVSDARPHVVVLGGGFGGLKAVRALGDAVARDLAREETRHDLEIRRILVRPQDGSVELF